MTWSHFRFCDDLTQTHQAREDDKYICNPHTATKRKPGRVEINWKPRGYLRDDHQSSADYATADYEPRDRNENCECGHHTAMPQRVKI